MRRMRPIAKGTPLLLVVVTIFFSSVLPVSAQWKLVWSDEFTGPAGSSPSDAKWVYESGNHTGWGNNEKEFYCQPGLSGQPNCDVQNPNIKQDGKGYLVIEARKERANGAWTSGRMKTKGLFSQQYGRFEARMKLPKGQGIWPAFWLLGAGPESASWPQCGEIDIMENLGHDPSRVHGSMHGPGYSGAHPLTSSYVLPGTRTFADDFHVFAVEWESQVIRFYVDDVLYETRTPKDIPPGTQWVYDHPFYILLNLAVGGNWPKDPDDTTVSSASMLVDYVRVYTRGEMQR